MIGHGNSTAVGLGNINYLIQFLQEAIEVFSFILTTSGKGVSQSYHSHIIPTASYPSVREKLLESANMFTETLVTCKPLLNTSQLFRNIQVNFRQYATGKNKRNSLAK